MLKGLRTVIYGVSNIEEGRNWYTKAIGSAPYFDQPFYVGGFELGLDPNAKPVQSENTGVVAYWDVDNIEDEHQRLLSIGAKEHGEIQDVGEDIKVATVIDPFGNLVGIIYNPNSKAE